MGLPVPPPNRLALLRRSYKELVWAGLWMPQTSLWHKLICRTMGFASQSIEKELQNRNSVEDCCRRLGIFTAKQDMKAGIWWLRAKDAPSPDFLVCRMLTYP